MSRREIYQRVYLGAVLLLALIGVSAIVYGHSGVGSGLVISAALGLLFWVRMNVFPLRR